MIIEDIDALQTWLTQTLSPVCDADPQALSKYVVALVKKDKTEEELRKVCFDQLDVFLQEKTKDFVEKVFVALANGSYITPETRSVKPAPPPPPAKPVVSKEPLSPVRRELEKDDAEAAAAEKRVLRTNEPERTRRSSRSKSRTSPSRSPRRSPNRDGAAPSRDLRRFINERRGGGASGSRFPRRPSPSNRRHSRSRSPPHRGGGAARNRSPRPRTRSPIDRTRSLSPRKRSSRPRSTGARSPRPRSRSRTPPRLRSSRSPPPRRSRSPPLRRRSPGGRFIPRGPPRYRRGSRSRSRSPIPRERFRNHPRRGSKSWSRSLSPFSDSMSDRSRSRSRHRSKSKSPVRRDRPSSDSRGSTPLNDSPRYNRVAAPGNTFKPRMRCQDFDVKGFCMQGDLCPYDHGTDPVVVDDIGLSTVLPFPNQDFHSFGSLPPPPPGPPPPPHMDGMPPGMTGGPPGHPPPHAPVHQRLGPMPNRDGRGSPPPPPGTVPVSVHQQQQQPPLSVSQGFPPTTQPPPSINSLPPMGMPDGPPPPFNRPPGQPWPPRGPPPNMMPPRWQHHQGPPPPPPRQLHPNGPPPPPRPPISQHNDNNGNVMPPQPPLNMKIQVEDNKGPSRTVIASGSKRPFEENRGYFGRGGPPAKRGAFDSNRGGRGGGVPGVRRPFNPSYAENASLRLRKIPPNLNNISSINNHFSKFGNLTNVQVCYKGEMDCALITFANHAQASAAYKSPEPVLNNRFVRVFWHRKDDEEEGAPGPAGGEPSSNNQSSSSSSLSPPVVVSQASVSGSSSGMVGTDDASDATTRRPSVKERLGIPPAHKLSLNNTKNTAPTADKTDDGAATVVSPTGNLMRTVFNLTASGSRPDAVPAAALPPSSATQPPKPLHTRRQEQHITRMALRKNLDLNKKKQVLLTQQLEQQKKLFLKLEDKDMAAKDKQAIIRTIKILAPSIEKLKREITEFSQAAKKVSVRRRKVVFKVSRRSLDFNNASVPTPPVRSEAPSAAATAKPSVTSPTTDPQEGFMNVLNETKKAILDTELDLISKKSSGADASELRKKVAELKREAHSLGLLGAAARGGRGGYRGGGRGGRGGRHALAGSLDMSHSLDKRPKELLVSHFDLADKDEVVAHMSTFGDVANIVHDDSAPSVIITYATRQHAERAVREGYSFKNKHLMMAWHKPLNKPPRTPTTPKTPTSTSSAGLTINAATPKSPMGRPPSVNSPAGPLGKSPCESPSLGEVTLGEEEDGAEQEEEEEEEERDDEPLEGEDLVGGPGSYVIDDEEELDDVDEDVLLGLDDEEEEDDSHAWKR